MNEREQQYLQVKSQLQNEKICKWQSRIERETNGQGRLPAGGRFNRNGIMMICVHMGPKKQRYMCFSIVNAMIR